MATSISPARPRASAEEATKQNRGLPAWSHAMLRVGVPSTARVGLHNAAVAPIRRWLAVPAAGGRASRNSSPPSEHGSASAVAAPPASDVLMAVGAIETALRQSRHRRLRAIGAAVPADVQGTALLGGAMKTQLVVPEATLHRQRCDAVTGCFNAGLLHESLLAAADPSAVGAAGVPAATGGFAMPRSSLRDADARLAAAEAAAWTGQLLGVSADYVQPHVLGPADGIVIPTQPTPTTGPGSVSLATGGGSAPLSTADAQALAFRVRATVAHLLHGAVADAVDSWPRLPLSHVAMVEEALPRTTHVNPSLRSAYPAVATGRKAAAAAGSGVGGGAASLAVPSNAQQPSGAGTAATSVDLATPWRVDMPISAFVPHALHQAAEGRVAALSARRAAGLLNVTRGRRGDVDAASGSGSASDEPGGSGSGGDEAVDAVSDSAGGHVDAPATTPAKTATSAGYPLAVTRLPVADSVVGSLLERLKRGALLPPALLSPLLAHAVTSPDPADVVAGCELVSQTLASIPQIAFLVARHLTAYAQVRG